MPLSGNSGFDDLDPAAAERASILIVDDLPEKLLVIETILEDLGQNLVVVRSGTEALREVLKQEFAVILLDVNMPGMDGLETARLLRTYRRSAHTPIIFVTAYADELQTAQGYSLGAVDYILSPVVAEVLRSKVKVFVELHISQRRLRAQALERIALATAEAAQRAAEENTRRSNFLSHASRVLASSLDVGIGMHRLLELVVPEMSSRATLVLLGDAQGPDRVMRCEAAYLTANLAKEAIEQRSFSESLIEDLPQPVQDALLDLNRPGEMAFEGASPTARFSLGSQTILPIVTGERPLGALLIETPNTRLDWALLEELANRAAMAFENARLYRNLQIEIIERRQAQTQLQESNQRKDEFLAMLSHELRNPLAPIRNAVEVIRRLSADADPRVVWANEVTERQVNQLTRLVEELLDVARISQGKISLRVAPVDLCAVVSQGVETVRDLIEKRRHHLRLQLPEQPLWLQGDAARLSQVVANLLHNAAKYTEEGGNIELSLQVEGTQAVICVRDNGQGIDAALLPRVFELFEQGKRSLDRSQGGLGVGLTLVQRLVQLHHGEVSVKSGGSGQGSEFRVVLPGLQPQSAPATADSVLPAAPAASAEADCRVLVVDDNPDIAQTIATYLELTDHEVRVVHDGMQALECVAAFAPQVVVLDIGLPMLDGYEVARRMRAMPELHAAPPLLIALTGYGQSQDRVQAQSAGFAAHLVKPADPQALVQLIADWRAGLMNSVRADDPAQQPVAEITAYPDGS